jgi:hypothetical protein
MSTTFTIQQSNVFDEVVQVSEYTGDKMTGDDGAYDRIRVIKDNEVELKRFWNECRAEVANAFMRQLASEGMYATENATQTSDTGDYYKLTLNLSANFESHLVDSMTLGLKAYFVQSIVARWYVYANKPEAAEYAQRAAALLEETREKSYFKKRPTRPT